MAGKPMLAPVAILIVVGALALATAVHAGSFSLTFTNCASSIISFTNQALQGNMLYGDTFTVDGPVTVIVYIDVSSTAPMELAFGPITSAGYVDITWQTPASATLVGTYTISVTEPGEYFIGVYNTGASPVYVEGFMNVTMCGEPALSSWLSQFLTLNNTPVGEEMAPMGIVAYGVIEAGGQYYAYTLTTDAVEGVVYIPSTVSASDYYPDGTYYGNAFSIQLNAFVAVELTNGQTQYYWIQNIVGPENGQLLVEDSVWNDTTAHSHLSLSAISGNGKLYFYETGFGNYYAYGMQNPVSFGQVTLEIRVHASGGSVIIDFYANGQDYDTVTITPSAPATSAYIVIAPEETFRGTPLDLELVLAGFSGYEPYAVLQSGSLQLQLYVDMDGHWVPPPSAWTIGHSTYERSYASVSSNGVGSAVVEPGQPDAEELWGGTVIVSPSGVFVTTSTDLTKYAYPAVVDLGNGVRLVLQSVLINGKQAGEDALANVPLGSLIFIHYEAVANVSTAIMGLPALYASATLTCGAKSVTTGGFLTSRLTVVMDDPPTYRCTVSTRTLPLPFFVVIVAFAAVFLAVAAARTGSRVEVNKVEEKVEVRREVEVPRIEVGDAGRHAERAMELLRKGRFENALVEIDDAIDLDSRNPNYYGVKAEILTRLGRLGEALVVYDEAIRLDPRNPDYHYAKARILMALGSPEGALRELDEAIRLSPDRAEYRLERDRVVEAVEARRKAAELAAQCFSLGLFELRNFIARYRKYESGFEDWQVVSHISSVVYTMLREGKERNCQNLRELIKLVVGVELDRAGINRFSVKRAYLHGMDREVQEIIRELFPNAKQI